MAERRAVAVVVAVTAAAAMPATTRGSMMDGRTEAAGGTVRNYNTGPRYDKGLHDACTEAAAEKKHREGGWLLSQGAEEGRRRARSWQEAPAILIHFFRGAD